MTLFDVSGKAVVVTGAAGGLGSAMLRGLGEAGARVIGADIKTPSECYSQRALFRQADISSEAQVEDLVAFACDRFGGIDIMVANAALPGGARAEDETECGFDQVMAVNAR